LFAIGSNFLEFIQEDLVFTLDGKTFELKGDYWFCNNTEEDITQQLFFPIPSDSLNLPAEKVTLQAVKPLPEQKVRLIDVTKQGFWFEVSLPAKTILVCKISYKQKITGKTATYVLRSTQSWGKPLEHARYTLVTRNKLRKTYPPLQDAAVKHKIFTKHYIWEYTNFMPEADFRIQFE